MNNVYFVGEIGINHNGSMDLAKQLIKQAKDIGFDAVKFQKRTPEICVPKEKANLMRETPWGIMSYMEYKKKIEFGKKEYDEIDKYCKKLGIDWFASAWDIPSFEFLKQYKLKYYKVPSAMITYRDLLKEIAKEKTHTFLSTGMCEMKDIYEAVNIFEWFKTPITLLHAVSVYPCPESMCNINFINVLKNEFKCPVGYSGHEEGLVPSVLAVSLGATVIERHITLDRAMWGTDQSASLEKRGQEILIRDCNSVKEILGTGEKMFSQAEKEKAEMLRWW